MIQDFIVNLLGPDLAELLGFAFGLSLLFFILGRFLKNEKL